VKAASPTWNIVFPRRTNAGIWNLLQHLRDVSEPFLTTKTPSVSSLRGCGCLAGAVESDGVRRTIF